MNLLSDLNPVQREAVTYNDGPALIIAGAGSGKTRVLTYKVAYLLEQGVPANRILCLTFTNKAAREMKERIQRLVPPESARYLWMGTFHSIAARILRLEADKLGFTRDFSIYDTPDMKSVVKQICKERGLDEKIYKPNMLLAKISNAKNHLENADTYAASQAHAKEDRFDRLYEMAAVYKQYELRLRAANAMDFDDLLMNLCILLQTHPDARAYYQSMFQYILVDEYQDTNHVQYQLVRVLGEPQNLVFVVGDDAQSIYSFRGADIRNILSFRNGYTNARLFKLEQNYRSTQRIVCAANSLIHHNANQIYKEVYSENDLGERLTLTGYMSDRDEATGVAEDIRRTKMTSGMTYNDMAVLYRTNAQSRAFENELRRLNIPYRIYGGTSFYQRKEIKDAIGYMRLAVNPQDTEALLRIINFPARGIGDTTIKKVSECAVTNNVSMAEVVANPAQYGLSLTPRTMQQIGSFNALMALLGEDLETMDAYQFADEALHRSGIMTAAALDTTPEGIDRKQNLDELLSGIHDFVEQRRQEGIDFTPVQDFLAEVALLTDQDEHVDDRTPRVTLLTVHAAKGLEFSCVYIVGLEENLFPSQFCQQAHEIEEERRLLYVAITRAKTRCALTYARQRFKNGTVNFSSPSRFIRDIDRQYIQELRPTAGAPTMPTWSSRSSWGNPAQPAQPVQPVKLVKLVKPVQPASQQATESEFQPADRVSHRVFGKGTVQRVYRENDNDKIEIQFDGPGKKTLLLTYAKLEKIE